VIAAAVLAVALAAGGAPTVSDHEYDRIHEGQSRARVERIFDTHGERVVMWATGHRRHLIKRYPAADGGWVVIELVGRLQKRPLRGPYHVLTKDRTTS